MGSILKVRAAVIAFILGIAFMLTAEAAKPTVSIAEMVPRATHIVAGKVVAETSISPARKTASGEWSPERRRVTVETERVLKASGDNPIPKRFEFEAEALTFEKGASYVLFLTSPTTPPNDDKAPTPAVRFEHLASPARRVEATEATIEEVRKEIQTIQQAK